MISAPASEELIDFVGQLSERSEKVREREVHPSVDNMLKITSEGRKAALDMRLVRPALEESPESKIEALVERPGGHVARRDGGDAASNEDANLSQMIADALREMDEALAERSSLL